MDKTLGFIGIINKGRKVLIGESAYYQIEKGYYSFLASDCSENTKKAALKALKKKEMPVDTSHTKGELGKAIGYQEVSFLIVTDKKAAKKLMSEKGDEI